jgi:hypothetical protein
MAFGQNTKNKVSNTKNRFANALFGTPTVDYGAENQAYLDELAKDTSFQDLAQRNNLTTDEALAGVMQGLNYGNKDIAQKQQELGINIPQDNEQIGLARQGLLNDYTTRQGGLVNNIVSGYEENLNNKFNPSNLEFGQNKGLGTRIGEAFGTTTRFLNSPIGRGLAVGGAALALGSGVPLASILGVKSAVGRQKAITGDKIYRNQLKKLSMSDDEENEINAIPGIITDDIFKNYTLANYRNNMTNYRNIKLDKDTYIKQQQNIYKMLNDGVITAEEATRQMQLLNDEYQKQNPMDMQESNKTVQGNRRLDIMEERNDITRELGGERNDILQQNANTYATKVANDGKDNRPETNRVRVQAPNGQTGTIPRAKLREAIAKGYKVI